MTKEKSTKL